MNKKAFIIGGILFAIALVVLIIYSMPVPKEEKPVVKRLPSSTPAIKIENVVYINTAHIRLVNCPNGTSIGEIRSDNVVVGENNSVRQIHETNGRI